MKPARHRLRRALWLLLALLVLAATTLLYAQPGFMLGVNQLVWSCIGWVR